MFGAEVRKIHIPYHALIYYPRAKVMAGHPTADYYTVEVSMHVLECIFKDKVFIYHISFH